MKTRVISSLVGLVLLAVLLALLDTLVFNIAVGLLGLVAVYELLGATGVRPHKLLSALSMILAAVIPFARTRFIHTSLLEIVFVLILLFFAVLLYQNAVLRIEQVAMAFLFGAVVPVFFSCAVYLRDDFGMVAGGFYLLVALGAAWLSDTGAYFCGILLGKHKLAPHVSPKKTVEGSVGGVIVCTGLMLLLALGYSAFVESLGAPVAVNYVRLALLTPVFSVVGMFGDLSASAIKRCFGVKDYGHIMPGHGGVMDRFDSVLYTLPTVYVVVRHVSLVSVL